ncbi:MULTISPECIES: QueT transporter family protein [Peptoniphilus]|uniref:QueT transporter family protein n=1 Tax=Peptoniphilus TaxID=162289 RepID=UPI0001DAA050|nr:MULTISPECIES: QueT transporter family protein [Peptoniphilus]EFI41627.1 hypothetical protein HMPREF0629_00250 [Peptoniphilus sp. oral taxon 386 str. F0131]
MNLKDLTKNAIVMAIYIIFISINPIGFGALQFRIGEVFALIPFFNRKYVPALVLGGILANFASPFGAIDMVVGGVCAVITYTISKFIKNPYVNGLVYSIVSAVVVSSEIYYLSIGEIAKSDAFGFIITNIATIFFTMIIITQLGVYIIDKTKLKDIIKNS